MIDLDEIERRREDWSVPEGDIRNDVDALLDRLRAAHVVVELARSYNTRSHHVDKCEIRYATTRPGAACECGKHALTLALARYDKTP